MLAPPRRAKPRLMPCEEPWRREYPVIAQSQWPHWREVIPIYACPADVRRVIYTTDEIDKIFPAVVAYPSPARVTAWRRAGPGGVSPAAQPYRRSSFAASVRPLPPPLGCQFRTACS